MALYIGNTLITKLYKGNTELKKLYLGNTLIYSSAVPETDFIMSVKTDNTGTSNNNQFTIPTISGNLYDVTTSDGQTLLANTGDLTITFPSAGTYDINISGDFRQLYFNNSGDNSKLIGVKNWGNTVFTSMLNAFFGCNNFVNYIATDVPDLSSVTSMQGMFAGSSFNGDISSWDVSNVTNMDYLMFNSSFNQDLSSWNVSNVTTMFAAFYNATSFDQNLASWNIKQVTNLGDFMINVTLSTANYDATLIGWAGQISLSYNGTLNFGNSAYTLGGAAATARAALVSDVGAVSDGGGV